MGEDVDRRLANALPQIVWTVGLDGALEWVNDRWTELTGIPSTAANKESCTDAIHPDDRERVGSRWDEAVAAEVSSEIEYRIRTRDGSYRWHLARIAPMRDRAGRIIQWVGVAFDMQDRREAEEELRASECRFQMAFLFNPHAMAIARETDGTFVHINDAFVAMSGFSRDEVIDRNPMTLGIMSEEQCSAICPWLRSAQRRQVEVPIRTKHGTSITLELTTTRIDLAGEPCLLGVAHDVTEQRAMEAALRHSEARARARADELAVLMDAVPAAVWITHDPECSDLRSNRAGNELLRLAPGLNISKTGNPTATHHLAILANGVELAPTELPVHRAARGIEVRDFEEEIRFDDGRSTFLYGSAVPLRDPSGAPRGAIGAFVDVTHLKHARAVMREVDRRKDEFLALLSHELRNPLAPIITAAQLMELRGETVASHEREVILRHARHLVRLVDDLLDVSRVTRGKVSLAFTELHGGTVDVVSEGIGKGSEFTVRLPLSASIDTAKTTRVIAPATPRPRSALRAKRILVVDDNQDAGLMISRVLENLGHQVRVANDPAEALALALAFRPEVAILDIGLPVMDGYTLGRELRARLASPPRLMALTGYGLAQDRRRSHEAGFVAHLVKPLEVTELIAALDLAATGSS